MHAEVQYPLPVVPEKQLHAPETLSLAVQA
jgi:hypothetical protein